MQIAQTINQALRTATSATTPTSPLTASKEKFADWLGIRTFGDNQLEKLVAACAEWAGAFKAGLPPRWVSFLGPSGTGKTHCARRLWQWAANRSDWSRAKFLHSPVYWPEFIQQLRSGEAYELRNDMKRWPVLFIDDAGAERDKSGYSAEELNTLIGCRENRWTILTSNLDIAGIRAIDQRIADRLVRGANICVGVNTISYTQRS